MAHRVDTVFVDLAHCQYTYTYIDKPPWTCPNKVNWLIYRDGQIYKQVCTNHVNAGKEEAERD